MLKSDQLLRIYMAVRVKPTPKYRPIRTHYNTHSFG